MNKYPLALPYKNTQDMGKELKYSLRSLENINNWDGSVTVIGGKENWFSNINHIAYHKNYGKPYLDQVLKMRIACDLLPEKFIASQDDIYITEPIDIGVYFQGKLTGEGKGTHKMTKRITKDLLNDLGFDNPLDFECHAPMLVYRDKLKETLEFIIKHPKSKSLQWRSLYGNIHKVDCELFEDKKTRNYELPEGAIISTNFYTPELAKMFSNKSKFEL